MNPQDEELIPGETGDGEQQEEDECFVIPLPPASDEDDETTVLVFNIVDPEVARALLNPS